MGTLSVAQVRQRVDSALEQAGYTRSRYIFDLYGHDTDHLMPRSYTVGVQSTSVEDFDGRERWGDEGEAQSVVLVRTAYRLRGDNQVGDYDSALDHEHNVIKAVLTLDASLLHIRLTGVPRRDVSPEGEWLISTVRFVVYHRFAFVEGF